MKILVDKQVKSHNYEQPGTRLHSGGKRQKLGSNRKNISEQRELRDEFGRGRGKGPFALSRLPRRFMLPFSSHAEPGPRLNCELYLSPMILINIQMVQSRNQQIIIHLLFIKISTTQIISFDIIANQQKLSRWKMFLALPFRKAEYIHLGLLNNFTHIMTNTIPLLSILLKF